MDEGKVGSETDSLLKRTTSAPNGPLRSVSRGHGGLEHHTSLPDLAHKDHTALSLPNARSLARLTGGITLSWRGLDVTLPERTSGCCGKGKVIPAVQILKKVSGVVTPGTLMAIMGASGSGKTTLMNSITGRDLGPLQVRGQVMLNGREYGEDLNFFSGYIQQEDVFIGTLTVAEHLRFHARLRMDRATTEEERRQKVEELLTELGLQKTRDTVIGVPGILKGISGGEKKRLAIATELLKDPPVLFADEPTSGLDSYMAQSVVECLAKLAGRGHTVLCTIHQPSSQVYALFPELLLLAEGRAVYEGPTRDVPGFFAAAGYPIPPAYNPADFFIQTLAIQPACREVCRQRVQAIWEQYQCSEQKRAIDALLEGNGEGPPSYQTSQQLQTYQGRDDKDDFETTMDAIENQYTKKPAFDLVTEEEMEVDKGYKVSYLTQYLWLYWRNLKEAKRNPKILKARIIQLAANGVILGLIYLQQNKNQTGLGNINGALFIIIAQTSFNSCFSTAATFNSEFPVLRRDYKSKTYNVLSFFLSKITSDDIMFVVGVFIFATLTFWLIGFNPYFSSYLVYLAGLVLHCLVTIAFGHFASSISNNPAVSLGILPFLLGTTLIFSPYLIKEDPLVYLFKPLQWISPFRYTYKALLINQWRAVPEIDCSYAGQSVASAVSVGGGSETACFSTGLQVIRSFGYRLDEVPECFFINLAILVGFEVVSYLFMLRKSNQN